MAHEVYKNGILIEKGDDETRRVTYYNDEGVLIGEADYTDEQNAEADAAVQAANALAVSTTLVVDAVNDFSNIEQAITDLKQLLGDNTTEGSIRSWRSSLTNSYEVARFRELADLLIKQSRANRRVARQTLRLARLVTQQLDSSDVGDDI